MSDWKDIKAAQEIAQYTYMMWQKGWDEANGGNISYILTDEEAEQLAYTPGTGRKVDLTGIPQNMRGKYVLVTATGSYFREVKDDMEHLLGICYLPLEGDYYEIAAGLVDNRPSSEFQSHIATHGVRLQADPEQRVVMHNHATHVLACTHVLPIDNKAFTKAMWRMITEAIVLFPDGIGYVPWCVCGGQDIADKTNELMKTRRIVVWGYHGVFTTGKSMHDAFGLLETVDKCAEVYLLSRACGETNPGISDAELKEVADAFNLTPREGYLDL